MPKVLYGFRMGQRYDFRNVSEQDRPESPFVFVDDAKGEKVKLVVSWHGFLVYDVGVDIGAAMSTLMNFVGGEGCCGRCIPGIEWTKTLGQKIYELRENPTFEGVEDAIALGESICKESKCSMAPSVTKIVLAFLREFPDQLHKNLTSGKAKYHFHVSAPCTAACPANIKIPEFIDEIRSKKYLSSLASIRTAMPFPGLCGKVCPHPCEKVCRRGEIDEPINIMHLKLSAWNYEYYRHQNPVVPEKKEPTGKNCAIIGAGPAGLAAAYYLALAGHKVDIFDMMAEAGGMAAMGIPEFREPKAGLRYEINIIRNLGVNIHFNRKLGEDISLKYLKDTYDASLISIGAWLAQDSRIEGIEGVSGVMDSGIGFLRQIAEGEKPVIGGKVIIVGGGNTAIDCARTARRFGCDVKVFYRRSRNEMPAEPYEVEAAIEEGVELIFLVSPVKVVSENGKLKGVECLRMKLGSPDATGRRSPETVPWSNFTEECDYLIPAIGQKADMSFATTLDGLKTSKWNTIETDKIYHSTSVEGIFAAGDCTDGINTVVSAVGGGRWAAKMMDRYISCGKTYLTPEEEIELAIYENGIFKYGKNDETWPTAPRNETEKIPLEERLSTFNEVEKSLEDQAAIKEAKRCIRCLRVCMYGV